MAKRGYLAIVLFGLITRDMWSGAQAPGHPFGRGYAIMTLKRNGGPTKVPPPLQQAFALFSSDTALGGMPPFERRQGCLGAWEAGIGGYMLCIYPYLAPG